MSKTVRKARNKPIPSRFSITPHSLLAYAKTLKGQKLKTLYRPKTFTVRVEGKHIIYTTSKGKDRPHGGRFLQGVCKHFSETSSLRPVDYHTLTMNASYTLALIANYQKDKDAAKIVENGDGLDVLEQEYAKSQGFLLDKKLRRALERYAMDAATRHFQSLKFVVEDHHRNHSYDLLCRRGKEVIYVEVKGTQTEGKAIILTSGEVEFARSHAKHMALFIFHSIKVSKKGRILTQGTMRLIFPWNVDERCLKPLAYQCDIQNTKAE